MLKGECTRFLTWTDTYASLESWRALASSSSKASPCLRTRYFMAMRSSVRQPSRLATMEAVPARNAPAAALLQGLQEVVEQLLVGHQGAGASVFGSVCQARTAAGMAVNFPVRFMQFLHQLEADAFCLPPASPRSSAGSGFRGSPPGSAAGAAAPDRQRRLPKRTSTGPT